MIAFFIAAIYFLILFIVIEFISRKTIIPREVSRKLAHITAGVSAAFLPYFMPFLLVATLAIVFLVVMIVSRYLRIFTSIHDVKRHSYGELFFPAAVGLAAVIFPEKSLFTYGILIMAISDGLAGLLGSFYGRKIYKIGKARKSYLGSSVFFIASVIIGWLFVADPVVIGYAAILTLVEAVSSKGFDNVILPLVAAALLALTV